MNDSNSAEAPKKKLVGPFIGSIVIFFVLVTAGGSAAVYFELFNASNELLQLMVVMLFTILSLLLAKYSYDLSTGMHIAQAVEMYDERVVGVRGPVQDDELFRQVYHNSPVPYLLIGIDGRVFSANVAAVRLFKTTNSTINGTDTFARLKTDTADHLDFLIEKFRSGVPVSGEEVRIPHDNQTVSWALLSLYPFTDSSNSSVGLMTLVDITRQKQIENAKSEFVSLASHQLRTPIAGMRWSAELLQLDNPDVLSKQQKKYIERMLESVDRMSVLVDDFLRVSRFELGTFVPEFLAVSPRALFSEIQTDHAATIRRKNITLDTSFAPEAEWIESDPNLVRMILTNLFTNALKYTPEGGTITVSLTASNDELTLTVADTGMGIPAREQDQIFQKLFRASNATKNVPDGTGLGLYIVREAVRVLKGRISFTSAEGMGTTFEVVVPFVLAQPPQ